MSALLALCSSVLWGTGDFLGGTLSRRAHPLRIIGLSQAMSLVGLLVIAVASGDLGAPLGYLGWGTAAGLAVLVGLGCFYAALAAGTMGVVAPVAATGAAVPLVVGLIRGEAPTVLQLAGAVLAVSGVALAAGPERHGGAHSAPVAPTARPLLLAGVAALAFGTVAVLVADGSHISIVMTLVTMRVVTAVTATVVIALVVKGSVGPARSDLPAVAVIAVTDTSAIGLYAVATHSGLVSLTAVLASLYPATTAVLAWRVHGEHLSRVQASGVTVILVGVVLIAAGGPA